MLLVASLEGSDQAYKFVPSLQPCSLTGSSPTLVPNCPIMTSLAPHHVPGSLVGTSSHALPPLLALLKPLPSLPFMSSPLTSHAGATVPLLLSLALLSLSPVPSPSSPMPFHHWISLQMAQMLPYQPPNSAGLLPLLSPLTSAISSI